MEIKFCVLKYYNQYIRSNPSRSGSIHLTNRLLDADHFTSPRISQPLSFNLYLPIQPII